MCHLLSRSRKGKELHRPDITNEMPAPKHMLVHAVRLRRRAACVQLTCCLAQAGKVRVAGAQTQGLHRVNTVAGMHIPDRRRALPH